MVDTDRWPASMRKGFLVRLTAAQSFCTNACCSDDGSNASSVLMTVKCTGPKSRLHQVCMGGASICLFGMWKRRARATPHSPPLSVPVCAEPEPGQSRS